MCRGDGILGVINRQNILRQAHADVLADYRAESIEVPENISYSVNYRGSRMDCSVQFQEQLTPAMLQALTSERTGVTAGSSQTEEDD